MESQWGVSQETTPRKRGFTADECICLDDGEGRGAEHAPLSTAIRDTETLAHRPAASSGV